LRPPVAGVQRRSRAGGCGMTEGLRRLEWPDCGNVRDVGGLPTEDGHRIRRGALVRSDDLGQLTPAGLAALRGYGVRRVLDLRGTTEIERIPSPLAGDPVS